MIAELHHVQITVPPDAEENARAFYRGVLDLPEIPKPESSAGRGGFWLEIGDRSVHVGVEEGVDRTRTKAHIAYVVSDLPYWRERLQAHGSDILESIPIPAHDRFEFRDPFGNRVELIQTHRLAVPILGPPPSEELAHHCQNRRGERNRHN